MQTKNQRKKRLRIIITAVLLLACIVLSISFLVYQNKASKSEGVSPPSNTSNLNNIDYGPPTDEQQNAVRDNDVKTQDPVSLPNNGSPIPLSFTATAQNGSTLQTRVLIHELLGSGTCTLTLTKQGQDSITATSTTQALPSSSTCQGFNTPTDNLEKGIWKVTVSVSSHNRSGSVEKDIEVK